MLQDSAVRIPISISLGAIAGALSRYYLTVWFTQQFGSAFPYGTFFINLSGCLGMGFFVTLVAARLPSLPPELYLLVTTGFLGAYTTFSTYGLDTVKLLQGNNLLLVGIYWAGSALLGFLAVQLGVVLAHWLM